MLWLTLGALYLAGCAGLAPERSGPGPETPPPGPSAKPSPERPEGGSFRERPPESLPEEARSYLESLSRAFRNRDRDFLLAQGETQFEREVRPFYDEESYLALLYRIGPYSRDGLRENAVPRLSPEEISRIEYGDWEEGGPHLAIRGRLIRRGGDPLPCLIMLIWKLREPKILGRFP
jgi:hypothetical protein